MVMQTLNWHPCVKQALKEVYLTNKPSETMKKLPLLFFIIACLGMAFSAYSQKVLIADRYTTKRIKLYEGDPIWFKLKGEDQIRTRDAIEELRDTTIVLQNKNHAISIYEIESLYFHRKFFKEFAPKLGYVGGGFLFSALVHPLIPNARYDREEAAIIGGSAMAAGQASKLFDRKRYKINKNTRIRIIDLSFKNAKPKETGQ